MLSSRFQFPSVSLISPASNSWLHCPASASIFAPWIWCSPFLPAVFWHQSLTTWTVIIYPLTSAGYIICGAQWKMKKWGLLFKKQKKKFPPFFCGPPLDSSWCFLFAAWCCTPSCLRTLEGRVWPSSTTQQATRVWHAWPQPFLSHAQAPTNGCWGCWQLREMDESDQKIQTSNCKINNF